jgi:hypothetical protein
MATCTLHSPCEHSVPGGSAIADILGCATSSFSRAQLRAVAGTGASYLVSLACNSTGLGAPQPDSRSVFKALPVCPRSCVPICGVLFSMSPAYMSHGNNRPSIPGLQLCMCKAHPHTTSSWEAPRRMGFEVAHSFPGPYPTAAPPCYLTDSKQLYPMMHRLRTLCLSWVLMVDGIRRERGEEFGFNTGRNSSTTSASSFEIPHFETNHHDEFLYLY